jgi:predicted Zn-dependent peptidase
MRSKDSIHRTFAAAVGCALVLTIAASTEAQVPDRSAPPELGPPPALVLPAIQRAELSNGARVIMLEKHNVPIVQVNLVVGTGYAFDPQDMIGLANMAADMMDEGAGGRDALQLADEIEFLGARLSVRAGGHQTTVSLHAPLSRLDPALELMADVALEPDFPAEELERKRLDRLNQMLQARDEPRAIASVIFDRTLFPDHPYGHPAIGYPDAVRAMMAGDLEGWHETYFRPNNAFFVVVGDVTMDEVMPKLEALFGDWQRGRIPSIDWPEAEQVTSRNVYLVDKPGAAQSEIRIGRIGVPRLTDDYYALVVMNTILGGSFTSRLNQNLREEHGYTYGAGSYFDFAQLAGPFQASSAVQTDVTDAALTEFMKELNGILEPVPDEELARAKNFVALRFPSRFQTVSGIAGQLTQLELYDLPDGYFNEYVERILGITQADVQRVAQKYVVPEQMAVIVVGDRATIEEGIQALDLGPISNLTIEDVLGPAPEIGGTQ